MEFWGFIKLGLGNAVIVQSVIAGNWGMGVLGLVFTAMSVFNIGCCQTADFKTITTKPSEK